MIDFILGVLAIISFIIILIMKDSDKKWIAVIGWIIILAAKIFA